MRMPCIKQACAVFTWNEMIYHPEKPKKARHQSRLLAPVKNHEARHRSRDTIQEVMNAAMSMRWRGFKCLQPDFIRLT